MNWKEKLKDVWMGILGGLLFLLIIGAVISIVYIYFTTVVGKYDWNLLTFMPIAFIIILILAIKA